MIGTLLLGLLGEVLDILLGVLMKDPNPPGIVPKLIGRIIPLLSKAAGETPEQTEERRARAEAIFAAHGAPIVGTKT